MKRRKSSVGMLLMGALFSTGCSGEPVDVASNDENASVAAEASPLSVPPGSPAYLTVSGDKLYYNGAPIRLKGTNLEAFAGNYNNIWASYWGNRSTILWLFDRLNDMGGNTVRLIFPDGSISQNADGSVPSSELDKLEDVLTQLDARGMRAIVTLFNRHNPQGGIFSYGTANRTVDANKVASFVNRFKQDPRIGLWDIANEPTMTTGQEGTLQWAAAMRAAIKNNGAIQPVTIGADMHFALDYPAANGDTLISLSDVVSLHCYARFKSGCTPASGDGVNYQADGFCAASLQYIRNRTTKPILLEEFGWVDRDAPNWPPAHPWCLYDFDETAASMDDMYQQALSAVDTKGAVGAIQWQLQDGPDFGLITTSGEYKRPGVPGSAFEAFVQWGGSSVRKFASTSASPSPTRVGIFRNGMWAMDANGNGYDASDPIVYFGASGDTPITGSWDSSGKTRPGIVWSDTTGMHWRLNTNGNGWDDVADHFLQFGLAGDIPVVGDWTGTGQSRVGVFRGGAWYLDLNSNGYDGEQPIAFGQAGDVPVVGQWSGSGPTRIGIFRPSTGMWRLDANGNGWDAGDISIQFGLTGDIPVVGDWTGTGATRVGVFRNGAWYLDLNGNGYDGEQPIAFGQAGDVPVVGDWSGAGKSCIGFFRNSSATWRLDKNCNGPDATDPVLQFGLSGDVPIPGRW